MQTVVTIILVLVALGYAVWRVHGVVSGRVDACRDCELKKSCRKFGQFKENTYLCNR